MTQEEKDLLMKDLCGRLPYNVKGIITYNGDKDIFTVKGIHNDNLLLSECEACKIEDFKPYLRPLSSMTKEEEEECVLHDLGYWDNGKYEDEESGSIIYIGESFQLIPSTDTFDWVDRKGFDYRGLIPKGLALEAPEGMYN